MERFVDLKEAMTKTFDELTKRVEKIDEKVEGQRKETNTIIIGFIIAVVFIFITVAVEVLFFHVRSSSENLEIQNKYFQEVKDLNEKIDNLNIQLSSDISDIKNFQKRDAIIKK